MNMIYSITCGAFIALTLILAIAIPSICFTLSGMKEELHDIYRMLSRLEQK